MIRRETIIYKSPEIEACINAADARCSDVDGRNKIAKRAFAEVTPENLSWMLICEIAKSTNRHMYVLRVLVEFLHRGLIKDQYTDALTALLPTFEKIASQKSIASVIFCEDKLPDLIAYAYNYGGHDANFSYLFIPCANEVVKSLLTGFLNAARIYNRWCSQKIMGHFANSLGDDLDRIDSYEDFNDRLFWAQTAYFKTLFADSQDDRMDAYKMICHFYRWLVGEYPDHDFFNKSFHMSRKLLFNNRLPALIDGNYYVTILDSKNPPLGKNNVCFLVKNMAKLSTKITDDDFVTITLDPVESQVYKDLIVRYLVSVPSVSTTIWGGQLGDIKMGLHMLEQVKCQPDYPNPDLLSLTTQEAIFIRDFYERTGVALPTLNNKIGAIRRFLDWCKDTNSIAFADMFFDYLRQYEEPCKTSGKAIPPEELKKMHAYIVSRAETEYDWKILLYVFHLLLDTDFRVGHILRFEVDCVSPSLKEGQYILRGNSKVSHDTKQHSFVITQPTYKLIMEAIEYTTPVREECTDPNIKNYIFVRRTPYIAKVNIFDVNRIRDMLKETCSAVGIQRYSPANLRDTYMTNSYEYLQRHGKSDAEMKLFSRHKSIDTTKNHYIDTYLENMLEATYHVELGGVRDVDAKSHIEESIPAELMSESRDVQNGCGKCAVDACIITGPMPCLLCKNFRTTAEYEPFYIAEIERIDALMKTAVNRHDIEDLSIEKAVNVKYLEEIYRWKETHDDSESGVGA